MGDEHKPRERSAPRSNGVASDSFDACPQTCVGAINAANSGLMKHLSTYFAMIALAPAVLGAQGAADLILTNGHIYTVDNAHPQVTALAVRSGRVLFVGSDAEAKSLAGGSTRFVDLHGATVFPGFVDAH